MTTRHEFLTQLHEIIKPQGYLEIGVHRGDSLRLAGAATDIVGVDPVMTPEAVFGMPPHAILVETTSDVFFSSAHAPHFPSLDLVFVDGLHQYDQVLRDILNSMALGNDKTIIACDDMLPRDDWEATRGFHEGDWAGDCWKAWYVLDAHAPFLSKILVNTEPTGIMLVAGTPAMAEDIGRNLERMEESVESYKTDTVVPVEIISRKKAYHPAAALEWVKGHLDLA